MITFKTFIDKPLRSLAVAALVVSATGAALAPPLAAQVSSSQLDQAVAALRGISTMTADFTQTDRSGLSIKVLKVIIAGFLASPALNSK